MTTSKYEIRLAVLIAKGPGRPDPKTASKVLTVEASHDDPNIRKGLASVKAVAEASATYGESDDYPYVTRITEVTS